MGKMLRWKIMAKFKGKKMVAFVAAEDVTSNMYTDCLGPKKRIKYMK